MSQRPRHPASGYVIATIAVGLAFVLRLLTARFLGDRAPFFPFGVAVLFAAWSGGVLAGVLATILGSVGGVTLFLLPHRPQGLETGDFISIGIFAVFSLITVALFEQIRRYRARSAHDAELVGHIHDPVFTWERGGRILSWNGGAERLYGIPAAEAIGRNAHELLKTSQPRGLSTVLEELEESGEWTGELVHTSRIAGPIAVSARLVLLDEPRKGPVVLQVDRDVSERKEREAREAEALRLRTAVYELIERLQHARSASDLYGAALAAIRDALRCSRASILLFDNSGRMRFVASAGLSEGYRRAVDGHSPWKPDARYPDPIVMSDVAAADLEPRLKDVIRGEGIAALAFVPLIAEDRLIGKFMAYFDEPHEFAREEVETAQAIARELAFGVQRSRSEARLREGEERLSGEAAALARLNELCAALWRRATLQDGLGEMVGAAIEILGAERGNVQLWDAARGSLRIAAHRGFENEFLEHFREVRKDTASVCSRALGTGMRTLVEDVEADRNLGEPLPVFRRAGVRAVQSTPLRSWDGTPIGMISTHWGIPHRPTEQELRRLDLYLRTATDFLERCGVDEALRREVGERQKAEARVRERAEELETILRAAPAPIWIAHDPECRTITGNAAASALLGVPPGTNVSATPSRAVDLPFEQRRDGLPIPPSDLPLQLAARRGVEVQGAEIEMRFSGGETRHIYGNAAPLRNSDGSIRGSVGAFMDVTELKKATAALEESDRRKNEFLATLGHELRNPLAPLTTGLELLRRLGLSPDAETVREMMERQVGSMARLVDDLLDINRINTGRLTLQREHASLGAVLQRALETSRPLLQERGHRLMLSMPDEGVAVHADTTRLAQVFVALLNNAAQYTDPGGVIRLRAEQKGDRAVVSVSDTGRGIAAADLPEIFQMFSRTAGAATSRKAGLGVGLSLARSLVEMHGGTIEARSDGPGRGCEFLVRLPVAAAVPAGAADRPAARPSGAQGLRVLVVDDNRDAAESLAMLLEAMGSQVRMAYDGEEAAVVAGEFQPDVALLDIGMPTLDGYEAARRIRRESKGRPLRLIALTGYGQESDRRKSQEAGFDRHLVKPLRPQALLELLADIEKSERISTRT